MVFSNSQAIVAIATASGVGGVGVIRISIPAVVFNRAQTVGFFSFCEKVFKKIPAPRFAHLVKIYDLNQVIDEGILLYFPAPSSYTGEHVLEFQGHGGVAILQLCLSVILKAGEALDLRLAKPGEFTERAFLNDKLDLAQAEAVADLIYASTTAAARAAMASLQGVFSKEVKLLAEKIIQLRLLVEATIDFPEEEIDFLEKAQAKLQLDNCYQISSQLLKTASQSIRLSEGVRLVLVGKPNVGKSSLLNTLSGAERAIVTSVPGTTRDAIYQNIEIQGIPVTLIDTAGLRQTEDLVEKIGIERTKKEISHADILLNLVSPEDLENNILTDQALDFSGVVLRVLNKSDLLIFTKEEEIEAYKKNNHLDILISVKKGKGLEELKKTILTILGIQPSQDLPFLARQRHIQALKLCLNHLNAANQHAVAANQELDLFAEELRLAHDALSEITGRVLPDDLLGLIFTKFCIGK